MYNEVFSLIKTTAAHSLSISPDEITKETILKDDFDAKSVNFVQIIGALEDEYEVEIDFMKFRNANTVDEQTKYVADML